MPLPVNVIPPVMLNAYSSSKQHFKESSVQNIQELIRMFWLDYGKNPKRSVMFYTTKIIRMYKILGRRVKLLKTTRK